MFEISNSLGDARISGDTVFDALIVGAGIVGTACARELALAGLKVAVLEAEVVGGGATAAGMGHIVVIDDSPAQLHLTRYSQQLWAKLIAEGPDDHEYLACGTIWIAGDGEELRAAAAKHKVFQDYGIPSEMLDAQELYRLEPQLRPGLAGGLLVPKDGVLYPPRSAAALLNAAIAHGAILLKGTAFRLHSGGVELTDGRRIHSGITIVAAGSRSVELVPELPIRPRKGHLLITDRYPGFVRHQLVELGYIKNAHATEGDSVSFNVQPRGSGQVLIGSSRQFEGTDKRVEYGMLSRMVNQAVAYLPGLAELHGIRSWTGFRAATPDGLPLIGPHPGMPGLWLATGHEGLGITTSLATADLLSAQILGRATAIPYQPYLPGRLLGGKVRQWGDVHV